MFALGLGRCSKGVFQITIPPLQRHLDKIPDTKVHIVSWTQQYPAIVPREFVDKSSKADLLEGHTSIDVTYLTNYNNPSSWIKTAKLIKSLNADKVDHSMVHCHSRPSSRSRIINWLKRHTKTEVVVDLHFVLQKEKSKIDRFFLSIGIGRADTYLVHSLKTFEELKAFYPKKSFRTGIRR